MSKLYIAYLGGKMLHGRIGEDHEVVVLVAEDTLDAKNKARAKWKGVGAAHLDMLTEVTTVDGYTIQLQEGAPEEQLVHDDNWEELNKEV